MTAPALTPAEDLARAVALLTPVAWLGVGFLIGALWMRAGGWSALLKGGRSCG